MSATPFTHEMIARFADSGLTQYTAIQIFMTYDEWAAALNEYETALDKSGEIDQAVSDKSGGDPFWQVGAIRFDENYSKLYHARFAATDRVFDYCPLTSKTPGHTRECFPVGKTLKFATAMRNAAKKINKAVDAYNKAVSL